MHRQWFASLLSISAFWCGGGCLSDPVGDDGHLEHHAPAHKPKTFKAGVGELQRRIPTSSANSARTGETIAEQDWGELQEIIHWLPELAADSDLKKADWETAQSLCEELSRLVESCHAEHRSVDEGFVRSYRRICETLGEISCLLDDSPTAHGTATTEINVENPSSSALSKP